MQTFNKANHVTEDALGLLAMNDLPDAGRPPIEAHLSACRRCRGQFLEIHEFITLFRMATKRMPDTMAAAH